MKPNERPPSELRDADGRLVRPAASRNLSVPVVIELAEDRLLWESVPGRRTASRPELFEEFVRLADRPAESIRDYARRWGVLGICKHGLPLTHNPPPVPYPLTPVAMTWCRPMPWKERPRRNQERFWEPLEAWRRYSRQSRAILNIAGYLHGGKVGRLNDWRAIYYRLPEGDAIPYWKQSVSNDWSGVCHIVNEWLAIARVRVELARDDGRPVVQLGGGTLLGAIALQLALAISRTDGLAICSGCGVSYMPTRCPSAGRRRYCQACRKAGAPGRAAAADYRSRRGNGSRKNLELVGSDRE